MIAKPDAIAEIMRLNPTARPDFLAEFGGDDLAHYLCRLREIKSPCSTAPIQESATALPSASWN